jgi:hypothetical protein
MIARPLGISALNDQVAAGAFMWVFGSIVYLIPAIAIVVRLLSGTPADLQREAALDGIPLQRDGLSRHGAA